MYKSKKLYDLYLAKISVCYNKSNPRYNDYGGRNIKFSLDWYDPSRIKPGDTIDRIGLAEFIRWSYEEGGYYDQPDSIPYSDKLSLNRKDNDGPYSPNNCEWIPLRDQAKNKRTTRYIYDGEEWLPYADMCRKYNVPGHYIHAKLKDGWTPSEVIFALKHQDLKMHLRNVRDGILRDKDGFMHLIPKINEDAFAYEYKQEKRHRDNDTTYHNNRDNNLYKDDIKPRADRDSHGNFISGPSISVYSDRYKEIVQNPKHKIKEVTPDDHR